MTDSGNAAADEFRDLVATYVDAWSRGDGTGFASVFAEDADFTSIRLDRLRGRQAIGEAHQQIFDTFYKGTRISVEIDGVRHLRPDLAILNIDARMTDASGQPFGPRQAHAMAVVERQSAGWRIVAFQNMVPVEG